MTTTCPNGHQSASTDYCDVCGVPLTGTVSGSGAPGGGGPPGAGTESGGPAATSVLGAASGAQTCPNCQTENSATALFCEACGYDFTTGAMPRRNPPPTPGLTLPDLAAAPSGAPTGGGGAGPGEGSGASTTEGAAPSGGPAGVAGTLAPPIPVEWVVEVWVDPDWYAEQDSDLACPSPGLPLIVPLRARSVLVGRTSRSRSIHPEIACDADIAVSRRHAQLTTDGSRWWVEDLGSSNGTFVGPASGPLPTQPLAPGGRRELAEDDRIYLGAWTRLVVRRATEDEKAGSP